MFLTRLYCPFQDAASPRCRSLETLCLPAPCKKHSVRVYGVFRTSGFRVVLLKWRGDYRPAFRCRFGQRCDNELRPVSDKRFVLGWGWEDGLAVSVRGR